MGDVGLSALQSGNVALRFPCVWSTEETPERDALQLCGRELRGDFGDESSTGQQGDHPMETSGYLQELMRDRRRILPIRRTNLSHEIRLMDLRWVQGLLISKRILKHCPQNERVNVDVNVKPHLEQTNFLYETMQCILTKQVSDLQRELLATGVSLDSSTVTRRLIEAGRFETKPIEKQFLTPAMRKKTFGLGQEYRTSPGGAPHSLRNTGLRYITPDFLPSHAPQDALLHGQPHYSVHGHILPDGTSLLPALGLWGKSILVHLDPAFAHRLFLAARRNHSAHLTGGATTRQVSTLHHDTGHAIHMRHRGRAQRPLQQDNAKPHTTRVAMNCLTAYQTLPWPVRSPIEHVWDMMGRRLNLPGNVDDLALQLEQIWKKISQETVRVLYHSMSRLVAACLQAKGGSDPY
ncbi:uncharacterized protein TNCV_3540201 [Trichonephila clavipes]|nr:uncharacterized protein TNCV_3540201 [Trichonephila clavipes]